MRVSGRESNTQMRIDDENWVENHEALQDGARLQALDASHIYKALLRWHTRKTTPITHQETLDESKDSVERETGLRPTNEKLLKGIKTLGVPPRLKDHIRNMLIGKIKCGPYWRNIPGHTDRAFCSYCKRITGDDISETEQHLWLTCEHNGQQQTWETMTNIWRKTTNRDWPAISLGLIKGSAVITFNNDYNSDSERLRILISMTIWAIWKSRNKNTINNQDVGPNETKETLKEMLSNLIRNSWIATRFMEPRRKLIRQRKLRSLWGDGTFVNFDADPYPTMNFV